MKNARFQFQFQARYRSQARTIVGFALLSVLAAVVSACTTVPTSEAGRRQMEKTERVANRIDGRVGN